MGKRSDRQRAAQRSARERETRDERRGDERDERDPQALCFEKEPLCCDLPQTLEERTRERERERERKSRDEPESLNTSDSG